MRNLTIEELCTSYEQFQGGRPSELHLWVDALQESLTELEPSPPPKVEYSSTSDGRAGKALIVVNGLWELGTRSVDGLLRVSHMHLLASLIREFDRQSVETILLDFRHPVRLALFGHPPRVVADRPWTHDVLSMEAGRGYRTVLDSLLGASLAGFDTHVIEPSGRSTLVRDLVVAARDFLLSLELRSSDVICVAGGILAPYLVEPFLPGVPGHKFYYSMSFTNSSLRPSVYDAVLTPVPREVVMPGLPTCPRPGGLSGLRLTAAPPRDHFRVRARRLGRRLRRTSTIVAIGPLVGHQMDDEYIDVLVRVGQLVGPLELVVIGAPGQIDQRLRQVLGAAGIRIRELGVVRDIGMTLANYRGSRAVVVNPRHNGNGGSLIQAAHAGLPVALFSGNDAESALPADSFCDSAAELEARVSRLLRSGRVRQRALQDVGDSAARQDRESRTVVERLVSWDTPPGG